MTVPTTAATVASHLRIGEDSPGLADTVAAVVALMRDWSSPAGESVDGPVWSDRQKHGATMLAARIYRRRNSPAGVESIGELGPTYVSRFDPDLDMLLGLGHWQPPRVG